MSKQNVATKDRGSKKHDQAPESGTHRTAPATEQEAASQGSAEALAEWDKYRAAEELLLGEKPNGSTCEYSDHDRPLIDLLYMGFGDWNLDFETSILSAIANQALATKEWVNADSHTGDDPGFVFAVAMDIAARARAAAELGRRIRAAREKAQKGGAL